jgi:hypothetical protein
VSTLTNKFTEAYLQFMSYTLQQLTNFNKLFQAEVPLFHSIHDQVKKLLKKMLANIVLLNVVRQKEKDDVLMTMCVDTVVKLQKPFVGAKAEMIMTEIENAMGKQHEDVRTFYIQVNDLSWRSSGKYRSASPTRPSTNICSS